MRYAIFYLKVIKLGRQNTSFSAQSFSPSLLSLLYISNRWHICSDAVLLVIPLISTLKCHPNRVSPTVSPQVSFHLFYWFVIVSCSFFLKQVLIIYPKVTRNLLCRPGWYWTCDNSYASASCVQVSPCPCPMVSSSRTPQPLVTRPLTLSLCCLFSFVSASLSPFNYFKIVFILCVCECLPRCLSVYHTHRAPAEAKLGHQVP